MLFLRNHWYVAAQLSELDASPVGRRILSEGIVVYRQRDGALGALEDACSHRRAPLSKGKVVRDGLQCGYHGMIYGTDGKCRFVPSQDKIPPTARVRAYPVAEKYGYAWVWPGDPALADMTLLPDIADHTFVDGWGHVYGCHNIAAYYELLTDNLLDLTHVKFVHASTLGHEGIDTSRAEISTEGDAVRSTMFMADQVPAPLFQSLSGTSGKKMDFWTEMLWRAPACMFLETGVGEVGAPRQEGVALCSTHFLTPETETTTHYFWQVGRNKLLDVEGLDDNLYIQLRGAFDEDKRMLESQQRVLGHHDIRSVRAASLRQDLGASRCRMVIEKMSREENRAAAGAEPGER
ncbi:MAG: aromatic ring-hydroxylating dioxygenase subunit alpha [Woeseia sp.]